VNHIVEPGAVVAHRLDGQVRTEGDTLIYDRGYQPVLADDNGSQK